MPIALKNSSFATSSTGANISAGASQDTSSATLIVVVVSTYVAAGATFGGITDSRTNTWRTLTGKNGLSYGCRISYSYDNSGSALSTGTGHTFNTTNNGSTSYPAIAVFSFTGTDLTSAVYVSPDTGSANSATATYSPGTITPTSGNLLVSGMVDNVSGSLTVDSGFSTIVTAGPVAAGSVRVGGAYLITGSGSAVNPTWNSSLDEHEVVMAQFLAGSGGGGGSRGLFRVPSPLGVGIGGSFFSDPLQCLYDPRRAQQDLRHQARMYR